jgi:NAD(P)-dependent dehydrogenase (short-subunit alcohol dehydrogenase family)
MRQIPLLFARLSTVAHPPIEHFLQPSGLSGFPGRSKWSAYRLEGTIEDIVGPAVWLSSSASDFVNGQVIFIDGVRRVVV